MGLACRQHLAYREIGAELGIDPSTAYDAVQRAAQMIPAEGAAEMRQAMLEEMDRMSRHLWGVVERQRSDLMDLDAPVRAGQDVILAQDLKLDRRTVDRWVFAALTRAARTDRADLVPGERAAARRWAR